MSIIWYLQINRICNHNCIYCSNPSLWKMMSLDEVKQWLESIKNSGYDSVILTWWEPTIHPQIFEIIKMVHEYGLKPRIITNGTWFADEEFTKRIKDIGVELVHISRYTYDQKLNDYIRGVDGAYTNMIKAMMNLRKYKIETQITTAISQFNQDHLYKNVLFIKKIYPEIRHFVWNILDPKVMKKTQEAVDSLPDLNAITQQLTKTFEYLESIGDTFRIEKIPLCKIPGYEWANTEVRKIVKDESRKVVFLDERNIVEQQPEDFKYKYLAECEQCAIKKICGWIFMKDEFYKNVQVSPIKDKKCLEQIINKILLWQS